MGIIISELLALEYFKDFRVLAGKRGLDREVQGVTVLDAPDGFRWTKGKEMVVSCGYVLKQEPDCIARYLQEGYMIRMACMVIKAGRYLAKAPQETLDLFEANDIPLLEAPFSMAYMEMMHQVNVAIINKTTKRFWLSAGEASSLVDDSYHARKVGRILQAVEKDMHFPALLYDLADGKEYVSSPNFSGIATAHNLRPTDFWEPGFAHSRHTLCDSLHMVRYRIQEENSDGPPFSWITVPISFAGSVQAYFVVMESLDLIDFYDEYSIRIATLLLQSMYDQLIVARNAGNIGFESLVQFALACGAEETKQLAARAGARNINVNDPYFYTVLRQAGEGMSLEQHRDEIYDAIRLHTTGDAVQVAMLGQGECLLMMRRRKGGEGTRQARELPEHLALLCQRIEGRLAGARIQAGYFDDTGTLLDAARNIERCRQALRLGALLYPEQSIWGYAELGPLAWLQISGDEMDMMRRDLQPLLDDPKMQELRKTLQVYLASNMSYSDTAEKMYVHINTVRKRIERLNDLISIDWNDSVARMKLELLLRLLGV